MVGHFDGSGTVQEFANSCNLGALAGPGTSCPDHFPRTVICPLVVDLGAGVGMITFAKHMARARNTVNWGGYTSTAASLAMTIRTPDRLI